MTVIPYINPTSGDADEERGDFDNPHVQFLDSVKVMECTGPEFGRGPYRLDDVDLDVQAYQLRYHDPESSQQTDNANEKLGEDLPQASIIALPNKELDGVWESYALLSRLREP